ncbi:MAG: sugar phosphate nucleotidyltransferase, partial [bacterium]|nr:sugar phosphate nucleotidyltransferase [bacterium]
FLEKPDSDEQIDTVAMSPDWFSKRGIDSDGRECLASMGIYIFDRDFLLAKLKETDYEDFGKQIFPKTIDTAHVQVHMFDGYWEDIGTIRAYYEANLSVAGDNPPFDYILPEAPVFTRARHLPASRFGSSQIENSLIADGCIIGKGCTIQNSVIGLRCKIGDNVTIRDSIIMGNDMYETQLEIQSDSESGRPTLGIGSGVEIQGAIVDKNCHIGNDVKIIYQGQEDTDDIDGVCSIREGIPVILKNAVLQEGWTLR